MSIEEQYRWRLWWRSQGGLNPWRIAPWQVLVYIEFPGA